MPAQASPEARPFRVDRAQALRYLGYAGQDMTAALGGRIDRAIERVERTSAPRWFYRVFPVDDGNGDIRLSGTTVVLGGRDIFAHLHGARECAVMAATLGMANERELRLVSRGNALDGMLFDAASSALVETVADACNAEIASEARRRGLHAKWRFSPGYGDLPLDVQPGVLGVLDAGKRLGISLTDANLMIPAKSITALVGLFDEPQDVRRTCANCELSATCQLRRDDTPCFR